ncbi:hypothetical protein EDB92DRAFT_1800580 [Lactarius akahatsu]|uniref:Utp8 C-terminal domain-containing protein n=1 Tax=Lactarius akahatsu TaxID=416441 RepID=A0AAD4LC82_9AGAM|nr:hypothetical protein EDB92DRAFT_1800580 [Lactarius akahatsu]
MSIAIGEPSLLSSYDIPWRGLSGSPLHHGIYVAHEPATGTKAKSREGFVTVTVQGDGVHILDMSDSHVAGSYALGPSTTFAGPSVSRIMTENGTRFRRIYAAVEQSSGVRTEDHGRVIWSWDEVSERDGRAKEKKSSVTAPHRVSRIYAPEDLPDYILLLSPGGDVTMMDIDLDTPKAEWRSNSKSTLLTSFMFPKVSATFLPPHLVAPLATLVLVFSTTGITQICVLSIYGDEIAAVLNEETSTVIEASCSSSGYITCLQSDGQWRSFELHSTSPESLQLLPIPSPMRLSGLSFIEKSAGATTSTTVSTLSLGSSFALICGCLVQSQDLVVLLWDLRYSVVLASHRFPIPTDLTASKAGVSLKLIPASTTQVLLSLSSRPQGKSSKSRSAVFVIPTTVPPTSTIATAMGRASSSAKWLVAPNGGPLGVSFSPERHDFLNKLRSTIRQNDPEAADSAFFEWIENRSGPAVSVDVRLDEPIFGHEFVREILDIAFQPSSTPTSTLYPPKTIYYLLENRLVSAGMLSQSLLGLFVESKDWRAVALTLKNVLDIPEVEIIKLVRSIHGYTRPASRHDMQVDATLPDAEASSMMASCVSYPSSDAALRLAIKEQLNNAESIIPILVIVDDWLDKISSRETNLESPGKTTATVASPEEADIPPLDKILAFLRAILDATFVTLLQHTQSHPLLRRLSARLQSEIKVIDELQSLHGPLELFAKTQEKTTTEKQRPQGPLEDWRRRRKLAHEQASMGVGLYQVEELVI